MKNEIQEILQRVLPNAFTQVTDYNLPLSQQKGLKIIIAASDFQINRVRGQYPGCVSLMLNLDTLDLAPQVFGGMGGQHLMRLPDLQDPKERHLAYSSVKLSFRKPKRAKENVLKAIERFAKLWKDSISDNLDRMPRYGGNVDWAQVISG